MNDVDKINSWIIHQQRERGRSTGTLYSYTRDCDRLITYLRGIGETLATASTEHLRGWVHGVLTKGQRAGEAPSRSTLKRRVAMCHSLFRFLHAESLVPTNVAERLVAPSGDEEKPKPIDLDVWRKVWALPDLSDSDRVAFGLGMFCGLRRMEISQLSAHHFGARPDFVYGFTRKGGKLGSVPWLSCVRFFDKHDPSLTGGSVSDFCGSLDRLLSTRGDESSLLDWDDGNGRRHQRKYGHEGIDPQMMNRRLQAAVTRVGGSSKPATPHTLRHRFCTFMLQHGVPLLDVSRLAGHSSVVVTQRYIETSPDPLSALLGGEDVTTTPNGIVVFGRQ